MMLVVILAFLSALVSCLLGWVLRGTVEDVRVAEAWQVGFETGKEYERSCEHARKFPPFSDKTSVLPPDKRGIFPVFADSNTLTGRFREPFIDQEPAKPNRRALG